MREQYKRDRNYLSSVKMCNFDNTNQVIFVEPMIIDYRREKQLRVTKEQWAEGKIEIDQDIIVAENSNTRQRCSLSFSLPLYRRNKI